VDVAPGDTGAPVTPVPPVVLVPDREDDLLEALAHELKTPVKAIRLLAEAVRSSAGSVSPEQLTRSMESILRCSAFMGALVERLGSGEGFTALRRRPVDIVPVVRETIDDIAAILDSHMVAPALSDRAVAVADPVAVRQVLVNLLTNAAAYSPTGSVITVRLGEDEGRVLLSVEDRCEGIPAADQARLFERWERANEQPNGSGLGLYLSRLIARAHGGDLLLTSGDAPGCRFTLSLPHAA
jgi:signal transduction histidine kinase